MLLASLVISGRAWLLPAAVFAVATLALLVWTYWRAPASGGVRAACLALKLIGVLALAACLLEPLWSGQRAKPGANFLVLLADNSQGMQIKDRGATRSRGQELRAALTADTAQWPSELADNFQVRRYLFDSRLQSTKDFSELIFDGRSTAMATALRNLADRYKGQPLAGIVLFTDGNATDVPEGSFDTAGLPPIYPVVIGKDESEKDIALANVTASQTAFEDAPVTIQAEVAASGYAGANIVAQVFELAPPGQSGGTNRNVGAASTNGVLERMVVEQTQRMPAGNEPLVFRFQVRPVKSGVLFYRVRVAASGELEQFTKPELSKEATLANNSRVVVVDRGHGPYRILYVAGRPNWEFKFLNRALAEDEEIQLVGLIRVAKREPKFEFMGRPGESSNPLYRGFDNQSKEEIESYDQPVLVRLNTRDELELRGGFPKTPEDLYGYRAVILGDLEADFFTPDQMTLLQKFVSERGGGFLMLGGMESFAQGRYQHTPVGDMLPVYLDQAIEARPGAEYRLNLTREGWLQPWARLRNNEADEKDRLETMRPFEVFNPVRGIKPGASVIATVSDASAKSYPAVVVQRFGSGRTAAITIGDLYHWGFHDEESHRDMDKAWRQLARWLVADVPERIQMQAEQNRGDPNQSVLMQVRVRDEKFQPLDNAGVAVKVQPVAGGSEPSFTNSAARPQGQPITLTAEPSLTEPGVYQATYIPRDTGGYLAEAVVTNAVGAEAGRTETGWTTDLAAEEFRSLTPNHRLMETVARQTKGEVISLDRLDRFARDLPHHEVPVMESWTYPAWHRAGVFLFALACFAAEWGARRWKGLA
jgi:hypothetical protein